MKLEIIDWLFIIHSSVYTVKVGKYRKEPEYKHIPNTGSTWSTSFHIQNIDSRTSRIAIKNIQARKKLEYL